MKEDSSIDRNARKNQIEEETFMRLEKKRLKLISKVNKPKSKIKKSFYLMIFLIVNVQIMSLYMDESDYEDFENLSNLQI